MLNKLFTTCETLQDPIGIDNPAPRFSWLVADGRVSLPQKSYRIQVFFRDMCVWDSGVMIDRRSVAVAYAGEPLVSFGRYTYQIECVLEDGALYCGNGTFEMGILERDGWQGEFLSYPNYEKRCSPVFVTHFTPRSAVKSARAYFCGLGYGELYINGQKTDTSVLDPGWTDFTSRVLYRTFDITELLCSGENKIRVLLGDGWMAHNHKYFVWSKKPPLPWYFEPRFLLNIRMEYENGEVETFFPDADNCFCNKSEILSQNVFDGETYSALRAAELAAQEKSALRTEDGWVPAVLAPMEAKRSAQVMPSIRETECIRPAGVVSISSAVYTVDMGINFSGFLKIKVVGERGSTVKIRCSEVANEDNTVNQTNLRYAACTDEYILLGEGEEVYAPRFTYRGFRFAELTLTGKVKVIDIEGVRVNSNSERIGTFSCSSEMLNRIYRMLINTEINNMHSVPTDCPQRDERLGWMNDNTLRLEQNFMNFDSQLFYEKWLDDLRDAQQKMGTGAVPDSCPYCGYGLPTARWNATVFVSLPYYLHRYFGDLQPMKKHWRSVKWYMDFQKTKLTDEGLIDEYYVGEWCPPMKDSILEDRQSAFAKDIKNQLATSCFYYLECLLCQKMAVLLEDIEAHARFCKQAEAMKEAINAKYFDPVRGAYLPECQGNTIFPLYLDIVPDGYRAKVEANLLRYIKEKDNYHLSTGSHMTRFLFEVLHSLGRDDVGVQILEQKTYPSFGYMLENGATALWERWEKSLGFMTSHDHPMTGGFGVWFFKALGGLQIGLADEDESIVSIAPSVPENLEYVNCQRMMRNGKVACNWRRIANEIHYDIAVPWNTRARIVIPVKVFDVESVFVNGMPLERSDISYNYDGQTLSWESECGYWHIVTAAK